MARAARVLLSVPPSSKVSELSHELEGAEARMLSARGARAGNGWVREKGFAEMTLFLHLNRGGIPEDVPPLSEAAVTGEWIPLRLS